MCWLGTAPPPTLAPERLPRWPAEDEVTSLIFAREGLLYSGHISGKVRKWELPVGESSEDEEAPAAVGLGQQ